MSDNFTSNKKYAIYGGTFDPIHIAHVKLADFAVKEMEIEELYFMPSYINPFKKDDKVASAADRLNMVKTVLDYNKAFRLSDYEIEKKGMSYTIETLDYWSNELDGELYFVVGFDSLVGMDTWYKGDELLRRYKIITGRRPDTDNKFADEKIKEFKEKYNADIHVLDLKEMDVSSTGIRERLKTGKSIGDLVLNKTEEYILEHNLYRD